MDEKDKNTLKEPDFAALANKKTMSMGGKITNIVLVLICLVLAAAVIYKMFSDKEEIGPGFNQASVSTGVINVSVAAAEHKDFINSSRVNGEVVSTGQEFSVYPEISSTGTVTEVLVKKGDRVKAGDTIAYVDASRPGVSYKSGPVTVKADGVITDVAVIPGSTVSSSSAIATVNPDAELVVQTYIPERFLSTVRVGMPATFESVAYEGIQYNGVVTYISPTLSSSSRTADVELALLDEDTLLKPGMFVKIILQTERIEDALVVPTDALETYLDEDVVFVAKDGKAVRTPVVTGSNNNSEVVILSGLSEGDLVITAGTVANGSSINIVGGDD